MSAHPRGGRRALVAALIALTASAASGQPSNQQREQEVMAVINELFDAMRASDTAKMRAVFDPQVKFTSVTMMRDSTRIQSEQLDAFLRSVGAPRTDTLDERLRSPVVHVDGDLATVWTEYDFFIGKRFSHCGVDTFQLVRRKEGWRIIALADTRRRTGCPQAAP